MACSVRISDGTTVFFADKIPSQDVSFAPVDGGGSILRMRDGSAIKQQSWYKEVITVTGQDKIPHGLRQMDFTQNLAVTIITGMGTDTYTCISNGATELWGLTRGQVSWSITLEEV